MGDKDTHTIKSKYRDLKMFFDFHILTPANFCVELKDILPRQDLDYLLKNYAVFDSEYTYWRACLKLQKIICNDQKAFPLIEIPLLSTEYIASYDKFVRRLSRVADHITSARTDLYADD